MNSSDNKNIFKYCKAFIRTMRLLNFIIYLFVITNKSSSNLQFIRNYINSQQCPLGLIVFSCWSSRTNLKMYSMFSNYSLGIYRNFSGISKVKVGYNMVITDAQCKDFQILLEKANQSNLFAAPMRWLILNSFKNISTNLDIPINSYFAIATKNNSTNLYKVELVYKILKKTHVTTNFLGYYSDKTGLADINEFNIAKNRSNLFGSNIRVSYVLTYNDSINHLFDYRDFHIDGPSKISFLQMHIVLDLINATKSFSLCDSWGYQDEKTKIFDGMFGEVQKQIVDIGASPAFYTDERVAVFHYLSVNTPSKMRFIFRAPPLSFVENIFTLPFQTHVWFCCYAICIIILLILYIIIKWENRIDHYKTDVEHTTPYSRLGEICMMAIGAVTQQGVAVEPKSWAGKCATIFALIILMFLYTAYSANIVVLLQSTSESIGTVKDMLNSKISAGVEDLVYNRYYFEHQQDSFRKAIYQTKIAPKGQPPNYFPLEVGIRRMKDEFFAFHCEVSSGYKVVKDIFQEHEKCVLRELDFYHFGQFPAVPILKGSPLTEIVEYNAKKLYENGIRNRIFEKYSSKKPVCATRMSTFTSVGLQDGYFAFLIFLYGIIISFVIFISEKVVNKYLDISIFEKK